MPRMYTCNFEDVAVSAAQDLFQIEAVTIPVVLHSLYLGQNTDFGDAAAEIMIIKFRRVTDALTNVTAEALLDLGDAAALADLNVNDTTQLVTGVDTIHSDCWNIQLPYIWMPPPEQRIVLEVGNVVVITIDTPDDSITMQGTLYFSESGS